MTIITFFNSDVVKILPLYQNYFNFLFDDPPYNLESIKRRFGGKDAAPAKGDVHYRSSRGFMNKEWDTDIASSQVLWEMTLNAMLPSSYAVSFGGTRTTHRMLTAAEGGGFDILDTIEYIYGSGFPKPQNVHLDITKALGPEAGKIWEGFRSSTGLKPAHEPLVVLRKPYGMVSCVDIHEAIGGDHWVSEQILTEVETTHKFDKKLIKRQSDAARDYLKKRLKLYKNYGVLIPAGLVGKVTAITKRALHPGARNSKEIRIGSVVLYYADSPYKEWQTDAVAANAIVNSAGVVNIEALRPPSGNWPANVELCHTPGCVVSPTGAQCEPGCPVSYYDQQGWNMNLFNASDYDLDIFEVMATYITKPTRDEKDAGLGDLPYRAKQRLNRGGLSNDPRWRTIPAKNPHPTSKSLSFCTRIATAFMPPTGPRRALVRFAGTGAEVIGLLLARDKDGRGWDEIVAVEMDRESFDVLVPRVSWWQQQAGLGLTDIKEAVRLWKLSLIEGQKEKTGQPRQLELVEAMND